MAKKAIRPIRIEGNVAYVPLTQGYEAIIDAADVPLVEGVNWYFHKDRRTAYAYRCLPRGPSGRQKTLSMHSVILPSEGGLLIDHIDTNGLNNRRNNLRLCTNAQNCQNKNLQSNNTTGIRGVYWVEEVGKWRAIITVNQKRINIGYFGTAEAAASAYAEAQEIYHGAFARGVHARRA